MNMCPCQILAESRKSKGPLYWVGVNGTSVVANLDFPLTDPVAIPGLEHLIGFPSRAQAADAQSFLLNAEVEDILARLREWHCRSDVGIIVSDTAEAPMDGETVWKEREALVHKGCCP